MSSGSATGIVHSLQGWVAASIYNLNLYLGIQKSFKNRYKTGENLTKGVSETPPGGSPLSLSRDFKGMPELN